MNQEGKPIIMWCPSCSKLYPFDPDDAECPFCNSGLICLSCGNETSDFARVDIGGLNFIIIFPFCDICFSKNLLRDFVGRFCESCSSVEIVRKEYAPDLELVNNTPRSKFLFFLIPNCEKCVKELTPAETFSLN